MGRIAIGLAAGLGIWFGSMAAAEAQSPTITTTGPLAVTSGSTSSTYQAAITLTTPSSYRVRVWAYRNNVQFHYSDTLMPNPGITNPTFSKPVNHTLGCYGGDVFKYSAKLIVGGVTYTAVDWTVTVTGTRPSKPLQVEKRAELALQAIDRDRRRE